MLIFTCQYQYWSKFLQIELKRVFIRIDARSDSSGPPVRCHAGQSARARALTRTSRSAAALQPGPAAPAPARPHHSPPLLLARFLRRRRPRPDCRPPHRPADAMVLEDESSDDQSSLSYMHSSSTDGLNEVSTGLGLGFHIWDFLIWLISLGFDLAIVFVRASAGSFHH